ncbi:2,3-dihydro-2,3-dihydroxybenzoate dehydrogenase [compost metagenome]
MEFAQDHIRVNAVAPGSVRTNILRSLTDNEEIIRNMFESSNLQLPYGLIEPEDVADAVCYLIEAKRITGQIILMDSGKHL